MRPRTRAARVSVLLLADDDALGIRQVVVVSAARAGLVDVVLHASSCQNAPDALGCDGDRGGVGVDAFDQLVLCQVGERFVQVLVGHGGSGEEGVGRCEEQGRVDGLLVAGGVEQPPMEGIHGVAEAGGAVEAQLLKAVDSGAARVGEVDVGCLTAPVARDLDEVALFQLEGEHGGVLAVQLLFLNEPSDVDVVRGVLLCLLVQPQHGICVQGRDLTCRPSFFVLRLAITM